MLSDIAKTYFLEKDYNCAESILRAANDYYNLELNNRDMIMVAGYGAGIHSGSVCGALLGSVAVLSIMFVEERAHSSKDIRPVTNLFLEKFNERLGSQICKDLKPKFYNSSVRCFETVKLAADCLEETINEYKKC
ncbi:MAG: C-GCAxxG-C-C family protein [Sphaerochaetaceae bacterium]|nr:C-GCAxxG-C-C family protein [Sphaerochaetaceae bacterium]